MIQTIIIIILLVLLFWKSRYDLPCSPKCYLNLSILLCVIIFIFGFFIGRITKSTKKE